MTPTGFRVEPGRPDGNPVHDGVSRALGELLHQELVARDFHPVAAPELRARYTVAMTLERRQHEMRRSNPAPAPGAAQGAGEQVDWYEGQWSIRITVALEDFTTGRVRWTGRAEGPIEPGSSYDEFLDTLRGVVGRILDSAR